MAMGKGNERCIVPWQDVESWDYSNESCPYVRQPSVTMGYAGKSRSRDGQDRKATEETAMTRSEQLADAMILVAEADHYMVGLTETVTWDELTEAKDILITQQNSCSESAPYWRTLDLAIDLLEHMERLQQYA